MKKEIKAVLKKVFMVAHSHCEFGETVVTEVSLFGELKTESKQIIAFEGDHHFDTELEAIEHIKKIDKPACIIQEVFVWV